MESFSVKTPGLVYLSAGNIYTGTHGGMWFRVWIAENALHACVWPLPWCFEKTDDTEKTFAEFSPDADGITGAEHWVETQYTEHINRWRAAPILPPVQH